MVENLPASVGDTGSVPDLGRSCATTVESVPGSHNYLNPCALEPMQEKPPQGEAHASQLESSLHSPQLEKARTTMKTRHSQK